MRNLFLPGFGESSGIMTYLFFLKSYFRVIGNRDSRMLAEWGGVIPSQALGRKIIFLFFLLFF